ncbi:MAG: tRNA-specific adenosine deaminase [Elusimicrobia bacterium]|nr:tRNA-specific adenosine deaminase [Elusimicrobiota bacterium]
MQRALAGAASAARKGEVPVGALLVRDGHVIAKGHNLTRTKRDPTAHAEVVVIQEAVKKLKNERFLNTILYVTLEPCAMCAGAIVQARIPQVVFGAKDPKAGACGSVFKILPNRKLNHRPIVVKGVLAEESVGLLRTFFKKRRQLKRAPLHFNS